MIDDLTVFSTIESTDGKYKLTALLEDGDSYCMTSFEFTSKDNREEYWDNEDFIFGELYNVFDTWYTQNKADDLATLNTVLQSIPLTDFEVVYSILKKGLELKFKK